MLVFMENMSGSTWGVSPDRRLLKDRLYVSCWGRRPGKASEELCFIKGKMTPGNAMILSDLDPPESSVPRPSAFHFLLFFLNGSVAPATVSGCWNSFNDLANTLGRLSHPVALGQGWRGVDRPMAMSCCPPPWPLWAPCVTKSQLSKVTPDKPPSFSGSWLPPS